MGILNIKLTEEEIKTKGKIRKFINAVTEWNDYPTQENMDDILELCFEYTPFETIIGLRYVLALHTDEFKELVVKSKNWKKLSEKYQKYLLT